MHLEVLTPEAAQVAPILLRALVHEPWTLAGGTGLALQLGHRVSVDFDWFCISEAFPAGMAARLASLGLPITMVQDRMDTVECVLAQVRCSFFAFRPVFGPSADQFHGLPVAPIEDIGAMKLVAASQRGARKDFYDLYAILRRIEMRRIAARLREMYTDPRPNPVHIAKSLVYFEDAEKEPDPRLLTPVNWPTVTEFFAERVTAHTDILMEELV